MSIPCYEDCDYGLKDLYEEAKKERDSLMNDVARLKMLISNYFKAKAEYESQSVAYMAPFIKKMQDAEEAMREAAEE